LDGRLQHEKTALIVSIVCMLCKEEEGAGFLKKMNKGFVELNKKQA
jgi:hypothetical protein